MLGPLAEGGALPFCRGAWGGGGPLGAPGPLLGPPITAPGGGKPPGGPPLGGNGGAPPGGTVFGGKGGGPKQSQNSSKISERETYHQNLDEARREDHRLEEKEARQEAS